MTDQIQKNKELKDQVWLLCVDRLLDSVDTVIAKVTSGSFISTIALVGTYCWTVAHMVKTIPPEKISSEFLLGFVGGGFASTVMFVLKAYFDRGDKKQQDQKGDSNEKVIVASTTVSDTDVK